MQGGTVALAPYEFYTTEELLHAYSTGPLRLAQVLTGLTEGEIRSRVRGPEKWSIQEIVMHVADSEIQGAFRIRKAWAEPGTKSPCYDQDKWTRELGHQHAETSARGLSLELFALLRQTTLPIFTRARKADWEHVIIHPEFGSISLRNLLELYADHSERHIAQILDMREKLGKPLRFPLLLPRRLY
jgi:hypothetical protein